MPSDDEPGESNPQTTSDPVTPRPLTIDDVPRLGSGTGIAVGCAIVVVVAGLLFWLVRGWFLHAN
jgi:hypothetical protein